MTEFNDSFWDLFRFSTVSVLNFLICYCRVVLLLKLLLNVKQTMANRSRIKSHKLRAVEIKFQQLQTREQESEAQAAENAKVRCELETLKLEHTQEVCLLQKKIENLKHRNRLQAKSYQDNTLSTDLLLLAVGGRFP
jgi:hypothetical protein